MPNDIKLKILSHEMVLKFRGLNPLNSDFLGAAELDIMTVSVREELPADLRNSTVLHECIHIIEKMFQLELTETQVDCLAIGMYSLLKENPNLVALLLQRYTDLTPVDDPWIDRIEKAVPRAFPQPPAYQGKEPKL